MKIGLINVDKTRFPNIALGKIATYHKQMGDEVEWADPMFGRYDKVYASKIFNFSRDFDDIYDCPIEKGGTGYDIHKTLPKEIDRLQPDYLMFPEVDGRTSYGLLTRGCVNKCKWCVVPEKEGWIQPYMDIDEITQNGRRPYAILMDNNLLAAKEYAYEQLKRVIDKGYHIDLNQANSARLIDADFADMYARIGWVGGYLRLAADTPPQIKEVDNAIRLIDEACLRIGKPPRKYLIYAMIYGDINECHERLGHWRDNKRARLVVQPFRDPNNPHQVIPQWQKDMARWAMRREYYVAVDFKKFQIRKNFCCGDYFANPELLKL